MKYTAIVRNKKSFKTVRIVDSWNYLQFTESCNALLIESIQRADSSVTAEVIAALKLAATDVENVVNTQLLEWEIERFYDIDITIELLERE